MPKLTFKPKQVTKKIVSPLQARALDVLSSRFGLAEEAQRKTLEAIGQTYGITRERVRQIENAALTTIRKSSVYKEHSHIFAELEAIIHELGGIVAEDELLAHLSSDEKTQNHIHFYLVLGDAFTKLKEDEHFKSRWLVNNEIAKDVHESLKRLYGSLADDELMPEADLIQRFLKELQTTNEKYRNDEIARRFLHISKTIDKNPLNEWGKAESQNVHTRGVKDYAYLVMRKHGSPMHFREVAKAIEATFGKKTHTATCHNELIKDGRFVLVGRGLYALKEWGYEGGVVRDVIKKIIKKDGPLSKDDVVDRVMKERYLKKNTILVNLQNPKYFKKNKQGLYTIA